MPVSPRPASVPAAARSPAARFDSPGLVRLLAGLRGIPSTPAAPAAAERLGQWLDWTDAIALSAALGPNPSPAAAPATARAPAEIAERARRQRMDLAAGIAADPSFAAIPADAAHCRASYRAYQRQMAMQVEAIRAPLRAALAAQSAEGAQLAALDAVLERAMAGRERQLLGTVPALLERHLAQAGADATAEAAPGTVWRQALLAELDSRWQVIDGLVASLGHPPSSTP